MSASPIMDYFQILASAVSTVIIVAVVIAVN